MINLFQQTDSPKIIKNAEIVNDHGITIWLLFIISIYV